MVWWTMTRISTRRWWEKLISFIRWYYGMIKTHRRGLKLAQIDTNIVWKIWEPSIFVYIWPCFGVEKQSYSLVLETTWQPTVVLAGCLLFVCYTYKWTNNDNDNNNIDLSLASIGIGIDDGISIGLLGGGIGQKISINTNHKSAVITFSSSLHSQILIVSINKLSNMGPIHPHKIRMNSE